MSFNILDHLDKLEPAKEKGKCICPVCGGHNFSYNEQTGAFNCWDGCDCKAIRDILSPPSHRESSMQEITPEIMQQIRGEAQQALRSQ